MAFVTLEDLYGSLEIIAFPRVYQSCRDNLVTDKALYVSGRASVSEESGKLIADRIIPMDEVEKEIWICVKDLEDFRQKKDELYSVIRAHPGKESLVVYLKPLPSYQSVRADAAGMAALEACFGQKNIVVREKKIL